MNPSANTTANTTANTIANTIAKNGGGESYRWKTLPSIGTTVKGCHLVPMKVIVYLDIFCTFLSPVPKKGHYIDVNGILDHFVFV